MYNKNDIVTFDDGDEYYIIDKFDFESDIYYYAVKYKDDVNELIDSEYCFFEEDEDYLELVTDVNIIKILTNIYLERIKPNLTN